MPQDMRLWEARALFEVSAHMRRTAAKGRPAGPSEIARALVEHADMLEARGDELLEEAGPGARRFEVVS
jgi:hypothetical protein